MKFNKKILTIFLFAFSLFLLLFVFNYFKSEKPKENLISFELEGKTYLLSEAKTEKEWEKGLMFVKKPVNFDGMIFLFPEKKIRTFWNKNTFLDLEIIWLDDDKIVGKDFLPSIESSKEIVTKTSPAPVNKVIELIK
jgi:uncharacterized membrane protein (UPF0127 family)